MAEKKSSKVISAKPKKQRRKFSEAMIVALMGLVGTIIAALLGSPLLERWLTPPPTTMVFTTPLLPTSTGLATPTLHLTEISVVKWKIETTCSNGRVSSVKIDGLTISGGLPPYTFQFARSNTTLSSQAVKIEDDLYEVLFDAPVIIAIRTDTFLDVTIKSNTFDGNPSWEDKLFYSSLASNCTNTIP